MRGVRSDRAFRIHQRMPTTGDPPCSQAFVGLTMPAQKRWSSSFKARRWPLPTRAARDSPTRTRVLRASPRCGAFSAHPQPTFLSEMTEQCRLAPAVEGRRQKGGRPAARGGVDARGTAGVCRSASLERTEHVRVASLNRTTRRAPPPPRPVIPLFLPLTITSLHEYRREQGS